MKYEIQKGNIKILKISTMKCFIVNIENKQNHFS